jgi:hypothetical protein
MPTTSRSTGSSLKENDTGRLSPRSTPRSSASSSPTTTSSVSETGRPRTSVGTSSPVIGTCDTAVTDRPSTSAGIELSPATASMPGSSPIVCLPSSRPSTLAKFPADASHACPRRSGDDRRSSRLPTTPAAPTATATASATTPTTVRHPVSVGDGSKANRTPTVADGDAPARASRSAIDRPRGGRSLPPTDPPAHERDERHHDDCDGEEAEHHDEAIDVDAVISQRPPSDAHGSHADRATATRMASSPDPTAITSDRRHVHEDERRGW